MNAALLIQLLGAFGLGSLLVLAINLREQRRQFRADVLTALGRSERERWATDGKSNFTEAAHELQNAALLAGLRRQPVLAYLVLAQAALNESLDDYDQKGGHPELYPGSMNASHADLVRRAAEEIVRLVWNPWRTLAWRRKEPGRILEEAERLPAFAQRVALARKVWLGAPPAGRSGAPLGELS